MQEAKNVSHETLKEYVVVVESYFFIDAKDGKEALKLATKHHVPADIEYKTAKFSGTEVGIYLDEGEEIEEDEESEDV